MSYCAKKHFSALIVSQNTKSYNGHLYLLNTTLADYSADITFYYTHTKCTRNFITGSEVHFRNKT